MISQCDDWTHHLDKEDQWEKLMHDMSVSLSDSVDIGGRNNKEDGVGTG